VSRRARHAREARVSFEEFVEGSSPRLFRTALLLTGYDRAVLSFGTCGT
jgi:hypothetical protein